MNIHGDTSLIFLILVLNGTEWSAPCLSDFNPTKRAPGTHRKGGWVVPMASLDMLIKRTIATSARNRTPMLPSQL
jgi:hypothetical protein